VAFAISTGIEAGQEDIFPDAFAWLLAANSGPRRRLGRQIAAMAAAIGIELAARTSRTMKDIDRRREER